MNEFVLHHHDNLPKELELPFPWRMAQEGAQAGDLAFLDNHLNAFDGERWQFFDLSETLSSIRPAPKGIAAEPLARALGLIKVKPSRVIDASCGSAKDALQVWRWGQQVTAYERNPMVYVLLWDALRRHEIPNFELHFGEATGQTFIKSDVIMYDPMFAHTDKKKSLPRKEMQLFKNVVGPDLDQDKVLANLLKSGAARVVIKRPAKLKPRIVPNHSFSGKTIRYDVYLP